MQCVNSLIMLGVVACVAALQETPQSYGPPKFDQIPPLPQGDPHRRFRREEPRGSVVLEGRREDRNGQTGQQVRVDANYNIWRSRDGSARVDANAYHERNWGASQGPRRDTGGMITFTGRIPG